MTRSRDQAPDLFTTPEGPQMRFEGRSPVGSPRREFADFVGQDEIVGSDRPLRRRFKPTAFFRHLLDFRPVRGRRPPISLPGIRRPSLFPFRL